MSIELQTGAGCLISDISDSELYAGIEGDGNYILRKPLALSMADSNTLVVGSGTGLQNGRHIRFKGETNYTIPSGVQAQKRSNIAVVRTSIDHDENLNTIVRSEPVVLSGDPVAEGEPTDPAWIEGNLLAGDTVADFPIARVVTDGINVHDPEPLFEVLQSQKDFRDSQSQTLWEGDWSSGSIKVNGLSSYLIILVYDQFENGIVCAVSSSFVAGSTGWTYKSSSASCTFAAERNNDILTFRGCQYMSHNELSDHDGIINHKVNKIIGVI